MINTFVSLPLSLIFFIYSIGAMILLGWWQLCLVGIAALGAAIILQWGFSILMEF